MSVGSGWAELYRGLLLSFPRAFRRQFAEEMTATFVSQVTAARLQGATSLIWLLARTVAHLPVLGAMERVRSLRGRGFESLIPVLGDALAMGWRRSRRQPRTTALAVLVLGVGFSASTMAFSILYGTVLRGLPFEQAEELVHFERAHGERNLAVTPHDYLDWREQQRSFEDLAAYVEALGLFGNDDRQVGVSIEPGAFRLLRATAALGRTFVDADVDQNAPPVILLSHRLWQDHFGADPEIINREILVNDRLTQVVGVMPPGFGFPIAEAFWVPLRVHTTGVQRGQGRLDVFGRLRPDATVALAREEFSVISARLATAHAENTDIQADLKTFREEYIGVEFETRVRSLLFGAGLVLLIANFNAGILLLTRQTSRAGESALLVALGASTRRLVSESLGEAAVLAAGGAAIGLPLSALGVRWLSAVWTSVGFFDLPHGPAAPFWWSIQLDSAAMLFAGACLVVTTVIVGLLPAWRLSRRASEDGLRATGRGQVAGPGRMADALVVGQLALMTALMVPVVLSADSSSTLARVQANLAPDDVITARFTFGTGAASESVRILEALAADPRLHDAALATALPFQTAGNTRMATEASASTLDEDLPFVRVASVSHQFFDLFSVTPLSGRLFNAGDSSGSARVALINASAAARFFDDTPAVGRRIRLGAANSEWITIAGVVPDLWMAGERNRNPAGVYVPLGQSATADPAWSRGRWGSAHLLARAQRNPQAAELAIRDAVRSVNLSAAVFDVNPLARVVGARTARFEVYGVIYATLGLFACALAMVGIYGVNAMVADMRMKEVGIRMALGATPAGVVGRVLRRGLRQATVGAALGLIGAYWLVGGMAQVFFQVDAYQFSAFALAVCAAMAAGLLACLGPARRASRVDPLSVLRA